MSSNRPAVVIMEEKSMGLVGTEDPVAQQLLRKIERFSDSNIKVERAVLKYGRRFIGIPRPKGYRLRAKNQCFLIPFASPTRNGASTSKIYLSS